MMRKISSKKIWLLLKKISPWVMSVFAWDCLFVRVSGMEEQNQSNPSFLPLFKSLIGLLYWSTNSSQENLSTSLLRKNHPWVYKIPRFRKFLLRLLKMEIIFSFQNFPSSKRTISLITWFAENNSWRNTSRF